MRKPPSLEELATSANTNFKYDFEQASRILEAMDFLRKEAVKTNIPEIITMVDAAFKILLTSYYCILRYEMTRLSGTDLVQ
jgi:hypothetical protein